jgi:hypothetical protein
MEIAAAMAANILCIKKISFGISRGYHPAGRMQPVDLHFHPMAESIWRDMDRRQRRVNNGTGEGRR